MTIRTRLVFIAQNNESVSFFVHRLVLKIGKLALNLTSRVANVIAMVF